MKFYLAFFLSFFTAMFVVAQNSCAEPKSIDDPQNYCGSIQSSSLNYTNIGISCTMADSIPAYWFKFRSDGANFEATATAANSDSVYLSIVTFNGQVCDPVKFDEIACGVNSISGANLIEGRWYYLIIAKKSASSTTINYCLDNPHDTPPPYNDVPCKAYVTPVDGTPIGGTTHYAETSFPPVLCDSLYEHDVWYTFKLTNPLAFGVNVHMDTTLFEGDYSVQLVEFLFDTCSNGFVLRNQFCGNEDGLLFTNTTMKPNKTYGIRVATPTQNTGIFELRVEQIIAAENAMPCGATTLEPNTACVPMDTYYSLFELDIPDCNYTNHVLWYEVITDRDLSRISLDLMQRGTEENVFMGICEFENDLCQNEFTWLDTYCGEVKSANVGIEVDPFRVYYVAVGTNFGYTDKFDICLNGSYDSPFVNDSPCKAYEMNPTQSCIANSSTFGGTYDTSLNCDTLSHIQTNWFKIRLDEYDYKINVDLQQYSKADYVQLDVGYFSTGCQDSFTIMNTHCGVDSLISMDVEFPDSMLYAYIAVSFDTFDPHNYGLCINKADIGISCGVNDFCQEAEDIGVVEVDQFLDFNACTFGFSQDPVSDQLLANHPTAWYTFKTSEEVGTVEFQVANATNPFIYFALYEGTCDSLEAQPQGQYIALSSTNRCYFELKPNSTYRLAVCSVNKLGGTYDVQIKGLQKNTCAINPRLKVIETSLGSPLNGPFKIGEFIKFSYDIEAYDPVDPADCQWLQGVVPQYGKAWGEAGFDNDELYTLSEITPINPKTKWHYFSFNVLASKANPYRKLIAGEFGNHFCYPASECSGEAIEKGSKMPIGLYAYYNPVGAFPNDSYGDGLSCSMPNEAIDFTFTLQVGPRQDTMDLSVDIFTVADGEIGSAFPESSLCMQDVPVRKRYFVSCDTITRDTVFTVKHCTGNQEILPLSNDLSYYWYFENSANVTGATNGSGNTVPIQLTNTTNAVQSIRYFIEAYTRDGCHVYNYTTTIQVYPALDIQPVPQYTVCQDATVAMNEIINFDPQVIGTYNVDWKLDNLEDSPTAVFDRDTGAVIPYHLVSEGGCIFQDTVSIHVEDVVLVGAHLDTFTVCKDDVISMRSLVDFETIIQDSFAIDWSDASIADVPNPSLSFEASKNLLFKLTGEKGCTYTDSVEVYVPEIPINVLGKKAYCDSDTVSMSAGYQYDEPHQYYWKFSSQDSIFESGFAREANGFSYGLNALEFHVYTKEGCPFIHYDTIQVYQFPDLQLERDSIVMGICPADSFLVKATVNPVDSLVRWETPDGSKLGTSFYTNIEGWYIASTGYSQGKLACTNSDSLYLEVYDPIQTDYSFDPIVCVGDSSLVMASNLNYKYAWSNGANGPTVNIAPGTYQVNAISDDGCFKYTTIEIAEQPLPNPGFSYTDTICIGDSTLIEALNTDGLSFLWNDGSSGSSTINTGGQSQVTVTDTESCVDSFSFNVATIEYPEISFEYSTNQDTLKLYNVVVNGEVCNWVINDNLIVMPTDTNLILPEGEYSIALSCKDHGCLTYISEDVVITLVSTSVEQNHEFVLYPNPVKDAFSLQFKQPSYIKEYTIYALDGQQLMREAVQERVHLLEVSTKSLQSGYYYIVCTSDTGSFVKRFVVVD